jgi:Insertion element 4 transposase N-terminal
VTTIQPGQCTLPPDATGRILDRLTGLEQIIPPAAVRQVLADTGRTNQRRCLLTHEVVCWVVLAMGILTELPIHQVFKHARRLRFGEETPHRSSLCVARQRLGVAPVRRPFEQVVHPLAEPETPGALRQRIDWPVCRRMKSDSCSQALRSLRVGLPSRQSAGPPSDEPIPRSERMSIVAGRWTEPRDRDSGRHSPGIPCEAYSVR